MKAAPVAGGPGEGVGEGRPAGGPRPSILGHVADAANLLTLAGVACSLTAIVLALRAVFPGAAIALVGSFVFDVVDGPVAKHTPGRTAEQGAFGANLDSLADMVSAGTALGTVIMAAGRFGAWYAAVAVLLAMAAALRLSFFNVHGLDPASATYTGLPTDLAILGFVGVMLLGVPLDAAALRVVLAAAGLVLAGLMVSPLRVPKVTGRWYRVQIGVALLLAAAHAARLVL